MSETADKILTPDELKSALVRWRLKDDRIVFTNGCFDILHLGHVDYLERAARLGNRLIVGLNSDESIRQIKGEHRPLQDENSRARILAAMIFTDAIVLFDEDTPQKLIETVKPDVLVKGADYTENEVAGADFVKNNGGSIELLDFKEGYSTSSIIQKAKNTP